MLDLPEVPYHLTAIDANDPGIGDKILNAGAS
jgi:hypothetical protein